MARPAANRPTDAQIQILRVLWRRGPSTVREVHTELAREKPMGYTTVLKLMQIMADKRLVLRDERQRSHVYRASLPPEKTRQLLVDDLLERVFGGSARALVLHALSARKANRGEMAEIQELLNQFAQGKHPTDLSDFKPGAKP